MLNNKVKALEVALLALDIAKACQAIHKHNIIHGDLKPHNVLLTGDSDDERGWIGKIADFGLSVKIKRGEQHVSGIQHGTEGYVAPEVLQTRRMVKASDVYSFGIIMWEMWHARLYYEEYRHAQRRMCVLPHLIVFGCSLVRHGCDSRCAACAQLDAAVVASFLAVCGMAMSLLCACYGTVLPYKHDSCLLAFWFHNNYSTFCE